MLRGRQDFLEAARLSPQDSTTGKVQCLSCGRVFFAYDALASHLKKHGGVNSLEYETPRIVASSRQVFGREPTVRPKPLLSDVIALDQKSKQKSKSAIKSPNSGSLVTKTAVYEGNANSLLYMDVLLGKQQYVRKKTKTTTTKRSILIHQVLTLTTEVSKLQRSLEEIHKTCQNNVQRRASPSHEVKRSFLYLFRWICVFRQRN